jgi:hypothetical protein
MKRKIQLLVLSSVLILGVQNVAIAMSTSPYPADAEASFSLPAIESHAERSARSGESAEAWGVSKREAVQAHNAFPFGGGPVDD